MKKVLDDEGLLVRRTYSKKYRASFIYRFSLVKYDIYGREQQILESFQSVYFCSLA